MKMKRKELEEVNSEFSDFSLSSPATKIRRLDVELPPIMEGVEEEEEQEEIANDERAIVVFKPRESPLISSPSNFSVSPEIISTVKSHLRSSCVDASDNEDEMQKAYTGSKGTSWAVIPWVPNTVSEAVHSEALLTGEQEMMESEEIEFGRAPMDMEEDQSSIQCTQNNQLVGESEGSHQWHKPHCMIPQLTTNMATPLVWFRKCLTLFIVPPKRKRFITILQSTPQLGWDFPPYLGYIFYKNFGSETLSECNCEKK